SLVGGRLREVRVMARGEAAPIRGLDLVEVRGRFFVVLLFGVAQPDPPAFASRVEALGAGGTERRPCAFGFLVVPREREYDRVAVGERVLVEINLVSRKPVRALFLERVRGRGAPGGASDAEERGRGESDCGDGTHSGNEKARGGTEAESS